MSDGLLLHPHSLPSLDSDLVVVSRRLAVFALTLGALACSGDTSPILLGTAGPWTELYGQMNKRGIDLAVAEINARGGIRGRPLRMLERDDRADGGQATTIAAEFLANRAVVAVVGHVTSGAMVAAARVYDKGLPAVSTTASSPDLSGISPWVFRVIPSDSANGIAMARFINGIGKQRAAILYENTAYGRGLMQSFRRGFKGEIASADPIPSEDTANFEPYIAYLKTRAPDVVFVAGVNSSGRSVLAEARRQHLAAVFIGGDGWSNIASVGSGALASDSSLAEGAYVGTPFTSEDTRPAARQFVKAFRDKYQRDPDGNAALGYDATMLLARAIEAAGPSRTSVRDWLSALGESNAFAGITGSIRFERSGDVVGRTVVITRVRHGVLIVERASDGAVQ